MKSIKNLFLLIASVFAISCVSAETTVFNSSVELDWYPTVEIDGSKFSGFSAGDKISLSYTNTNASYHQIKIYSGDWFALGSGKLDGAKNENGSFVPSTNSGTIVYTATSTEASYIKKSGLRFHGYGLKINKITISSGNGKSEPTSAKPNSPTNTDAKSTSGTNGNSSNSGTSTTQTSTTVTKNSTVSIYNSKTDLDWGSNITISSEKFSSFSNGNKIQFTFENNSESYHNIKIYNGNWTNLGSGNLEGAANNSGTFVPSNNSGTILYTPNSSETSGIKSSGLIIHGFGVTLKDVSITGNDVKSTGTNSATSNTGSSSSSGSSTTVPTTTTTSNPKPASVTGTPFANHGALHVNGAYLYDSKNQKYQLYGMSTHGLNFGNDFSRYVNKDAFKNLRDDWNTNAIRLVLYPRDYNGYCNGGNKAQLKKLICDGIDYATELGMYVIVDWHVHQYNPRDTENDAVNFLNEISTKYAKYDNVIYEICNEPTNSNWDSVLKPYAEKIIPVIRKNAPNALILVGTNTWSQDIEGPLANPLSYKNVMYVFHFYAQTHQSSYRSRVENAIKKGLPIFITEFGTCDASGNGGFNASESQKWFDLCAKYNISHMNWSLSNKAETASAISSGCNKTSGWSYSDLTESGKLIYNHFRSLTR